MQQVTQPHHWAITEGDNMRTIRTVSLFLVAFSLLILSACGNETSGPAVTSYSTPTGTGYLKKSDTLWILNLEGNYTDMGRQYGALLKNELQTLYSQMDASIGYDRGSTQYLLGLLSSNMEGREKQLLAGMAQETGLLPNQHEFMNASLFFMYANIGCSAFSATGDKTDSGFTIAGRNFDNPRGVFSTILRGKSIMVIYNPRDQFTGATPHRDNPVAIMSQIGWLYGLSNLNSKGIYLEYNNATNSIAIPPLDLTDQGNPDKLVYILTHVADGLHQNLYAAFDSDTLEEVDVKLSGKAAIANMTQVADKSRVWHYERSPYENSKRINAGGATGAHGYLNPPDTDIFTNHFFYDTWRNQNLDLYTQFESKGIDSGSRTFARLKNIQDMVASSTGKITVEKMKTIMTTHLRNDGTGGPFIGWELSNPDVTHFTSVTDVANKVMHIYPNVDAMLYVDTYSVQWATIDLKGEFR